MSLVRTRPSLATGVLFCEALEKSSAAASAAPAAPTPATRAAAPAPAPVPVAAGISLAAVAPNEEEVGVASFFSSFRWLSDADRRSLLTDRLSTRRKGGVPVYERMLPGESGRKFNGSGVRSRLMLVLDADLRGNGVSGEEVEAYDFFSVLAVLLSEMLLRCWCSCCCGVDSVVCSCGVGLLDRFLMASFSGSGVWGGGDGSRSLGVPCDLMLSRRSLSAPRDLRRNLSFPGERAGCSSSIPSIAPDLRADGDSNRALSRCFGVLLGVVSGQSFRCTPLSRMLGFSWRIALETCGESVTNPLSRLASGEACRFRELLCDDKPPWRLSGSSSEPSSWTGGRLEIDRRKSVLLDTRGMGRRLCRDSNSSAGSSCSAISLVANTSSSAMSSGNEKALFTGDGDRDRSRRCLSFLPSFASGASLGIVSESCRAMPQLSSILLSSGNECLLVGDSRTGS